MKKFQFVLKRRSVNAIQLTFDSSLTSDNNESHDGETFKIVDDLYFIRDKDDTLYWTGFDDNDLKSVNAFRKFVRHGKL